MFQNGVVILASLSTVGAHLGAENLTRIVGE